MDISVGDRVEMKKQHPCGCKTFEILRVGMYFKKSKYLTKGTPSFPKGSTSRQ